MHPNEVQSYLEYKDWFHIFHEYKLQAKIYFSRKSTVMNSFFFSFLQKNKRDGFHIQAIFTGIDFYNF